MLGLNQNKDKGRVEDFCTSVISRISGTFLKNPPGYPPVTKSFNVLSNGVF